MAVSDREPMPRDPFHSPDDSGGSEDVLTFRPREAAEPEAEEERPYDPPSVVPNDTSTSFRDLEAQPDAGDSGEYELDAEPEPLPPPPPIPTRKTPSPSRLVKEDDSADRPCRNCGYNLLGLPPEGNCPECGEPIGASRKTSLIRDANPHWARQVALGAKLILAGVIGQYLAGFAIFVVAAGGQVMIPGVINAGLGVVGAGVCALGAWLLTLRDPSGRGEDDYGVIRQIARIAVCIGILPGGVALLNETNALQGGLAHAGAAVAVIASFIWFVGQFFLLKYLEKLAARIPNPYLQDRAELVFWGLLLSIASAITYWMIAFVAAQVSPIGGAVMGCLGLLVMLVIGIALIAFTVMYLVLLGGIAAEIDAARTEGEKQAALLRRRQASAPGKPPARTARPFAPGPAQPPSAVRL